MTQMLAIHNGTANPDPEGEPRMLAIVATVARLAGALGCAWVIAGCAGSGGGNSVTSGKARAEVASPARAAGPSIPDRPGRRDVVLTIRQIAGQLEKQKIMYRQGPKLQDCSGMFHRVLIGLKKRYPDVDLPRANRDRTTRQLARWYHDRGALQIVRSAAAQDDAITAGTVMFYGRSKKKFTGANAGDLFKRTGIVHMGIVVDVKRNAAGRVIEYGLFHGRSKGKPAKTTRYHKRKHRRYPPYGNAHEPWVAFAPVMPGVVSAGE